MIIKIISLKKAIDRRDFINQQFSNLGLSFEFVDAIDPNNCSIEIISNFSSNYFKSLYNRLPTIGEIGASLSHNLARKKFLKMNNQKTLRYRG